MADDRFATKENLLEIAAKMKEAYGSNGEVEIDDDTIKTNSDGELYVDSVPGTSVGIDGSTIKTNANGDLYADIQASEVDDEDFNMSALLRVSVDLINADEVQY